MARKLAALGILLLIPSVVIAQGSVADYERAMGLRDKYRGLAANIAEGANWIDKTHRFWYRKSVPGGTEYVLFDAATLARKPAFDHEKLATKLSTLLDGKYTAVDLPFNRITYVDNEKGIEFNVNDSRCRCDLSTYECRKTNAGGGPGGGGLAGPRYNQPSQPKMSPDGKWEGYVNNFNVFVREKGKTAGVALSQDGSEGNYYALASLVWSPDSTMIAAYRVRPGYQRKIQYVQSSPADQIQPKYSTLDYAKPGDALDLPQPVLFHIQSRKQTIIDNTLFPNPYQLSRIEWRRNSQAFTFEYNQRGHQAFRVIEVAAGSGRPRAIINEESKTFFCYSGKSYRADVDDGREIIWMSERDGWNHLFLYDGVKGAVKNQITKGNWVARGVDKVDDEKRQIWFQASGMQSGKDPYFVHYYRINFDGTGLVAVTEQDANHVVSYSSDMKFYVDNWSRVDLAPVSELRLTEDRKLVARIESGDIQKLKDAGWLAPEVFTSLARDGKTDIWGVIYRPTNFDPLRKYPVVEYIYAGPQGSFVPKSFASYNQMQSLAELGFIVVQIDGMGTSNRSKAFHDVAWQNLGDAGFADRILWHKAVAAKNPWYDISRVGIYGNSAGGQNSLGGLLFHPEFYKVCVSSCGCHDNRMDKIWWNEQWMGWPLGPQYAQSSNVDNAHKLQGKLLLVLGEMDANVDPASTMQVVNALIKAEKTFDLLVIPNGGHGPGGNYGEMRRYDFFVHHLLRVEPPNWNAVKKQNTQSASR